MTVKNWMVAKAIVCIVFGIGFVLITGFLANLFGMEMGSGGIAMARLFGGAFIFEAVALWYGRNSSLSDAACRGIALAVVVSNTIGFIIALMATLSGVMNAFGWLPVVLYLVFALGFAYLLFIKKP